MSKEAPKKKEEVSSGILAAIGISLIAICLPFQLAMFGYIEPDEEISLILRIFMIIFSGMFLLMGICLIIGSFMMLVDEASPNKNRFWPLRAIHAVLRQALSWRHLLAALFPALAATIYIMVYRSGSPFLGMDEEFLERAIFIEFIAIHATGFLGVTSLIPMSGKAVYGKCAFFVFYALIFLVIGWQQGWGVFLMLASLVFFKFGPLLLRDTSADFKMELGIRWVVQLMLLSACYMCLGDRSGGTKQILDIVAIEIGLAYWVLVTVIEILGVPQSHKGRGIVT